MERKLWEVIEQKLYSFDELAQRWSCSIDHVKKLAGDGTLTPINISPKAKRATMRIHIDQIVAIEMPRPVFEKTVRRPKSVDAHATIKNALRIAGSMTK